jgi:hypothetical protein
MDQYQLRSCFGHTLFLSKADKGVCELTFDASRQPLVLRVKESDARDACASCAVTSFSVSLQVVISLVPDTPRTVPGTGFNV